jgi:hypothetical protein
MDYSYYTTTQAPYPFLGFTPDSNGTQQNLHSNGYSTTTAAPVSRFIPLRCSISHSQCDTRVNPSMPLSTRSTRTSMIQTTLFLLIFSITANHCDRVQRLRCPPRVLSEKTDINLQCRSLRSTITVTLSTKTLLQTLLAKSSRTEAVAVVKRRTQ